MDTKPGTEIFIRKTKTIIENNSFAVILKVHHKIWNFFERNQQDNTWKAVQIVVIPSFKMDKIIV